MNGDLDYSEHEELLNLILAASQSDFYFSHRVLFFMQANRKEPMAHKVLHCLRQVSMHKDTQEVMYLASGQDILAELAKTGLLNCYPKVDAIVKQDP